MPCVEMSVHFEINRDNAHAYIYMGVCDGIVSVLAGALILYQRPNVNNACVVMTHCVAIK